MKKLRNSMVVGALHGFEKEGLRITPNGLLSQTPHPESLGSSLMHPYITTDFAEPQLELRTPPSKSLCQALRYLKEIHIYTTKALEGELIWPFSMPPELPEWDADIPLAVYGNSAEGQKKTIYRRGIGFRYGRKKLTISGVHYNFSIDPSWANENLPGKPLTKGLLVISDIYFHIIRNLYRKICFLTYLFGASPAFDKSLAPPPGTNRFKRHKSSTCYGEYATSLRASEIGYTSEVQDGLSINYDSLEAYTKSLGYAVDTCNPDYLEISSHPSGQLNPNYLQAEYELYAPFRPKPLASKGKRQLDALKQKGAGYIELRLPDIDPAYPDGIDPQTVRFLQLAMTDCLMNESPPLSASESRDIQIAHREIIWNGRQKGISVPLDGQSRAFHEAGKKYSEKLYELAEKMDQEEGSGFYQDALNRQLEKWGIPGLTPSGKHLTNLLDNNKDFIESGIEIAEKNAQYFKTSEFDPDIQRELEIQTLLSLKRQRELEAGAPG